MTDENVCLLNARGAGGGNDERNISHFCKVTTIVSSEGHRFYSHLFSHFKGFDDIGRVSTGADADGNIPFFAEGPELFGEDFFKREVVGDAGEDGGICGEGDGGKGRTVHDISIDEFCSQVLSVGSASTISKEKDFVPCLETMGD